MPCIYIPGNPKNEKSKVSDPKPFRLARRDHKKPIIIKKIWFHSYLEVKKFGHDKHVIGLTTIYIFKTETENYVTVITDLYNGKKCYKVAEFNGKFRAVLCFNLWRAEYTNI